jgi:hypothetical protein
MSTTAEEIRTAVEERFAAVARSPGEERKFRRDFIQGSLMLGACASVDSSAAQQPKTPKRSPSVIDVHCQGGKGLNFTKGDPAANPWTTYNDPTPAENRPSVASSR